MHLRFDPRPNAAYHCLRRHRREVRNAAVSSQCDQLIAGTGNADWPPR
jgi:hypothetical protein